MVVAVKRRFTLVTPRGCFEQTDLRLCERSTPQVCVVFRQRVACMGVSLTISVIEKARAGPFGPQCTCVTQKPQTFGTKFPNMQAQMLVQNSPKWRTLTEARPQAPPPPAQLPHRFTVPQHRRGPPSRVRRDQLNPGLTLSLQFTELRRAPRPQSDGWNPELGVPSL